MMGAAFQYYAEVTGEKLAAARERVVARGVLPNSRISPGYVRGEDGVLVVERPKARIVVQAFKHRDRGASLVEIQALLAENGIERSISGVASMLRSRMYLGEIHFGERPRADHQGSPGSAALRDVRVADGDQLRQRQLPLRRHEREPVRATSCGQGRPRRGDGAARSGRTRPPPTRTDARRASSRSARRTRRSNAPTRISMTRSGSSASLDCWAGPRARRPWRNSPRPSMTRTPSGPDSAIGVRAMSSVLTTSTSCASLRSG
jgi:hypothetical protein